MKFKTIEDRDTYIVEQWLEGTPVVDIARYTGLSRSRVRAVARNNNMAPRTNLIWTPEIDQKLRDMWHEGKNAKAMAKEVGIDEYKVNTRCKSLGLSMKQLSCLRRPPARRQTQSEDAPKVTSKYTDDNGVTVKVCSPAWARGARPGFMEW